MKMKREGEDGLSDTSWQAGMQSENPNLGQQDCGFVMDFELQPLRECPGRKRQ
ncbi:MAG: hypothetical protein AMXMBFR75_01430 [Candidatus Hinthialibacteria bacterium]